MPSKKKSKRSTKASSTSNSYSPPPDFLLRLTKATTWSEVSDLACELLGLPDLNTRHGLKLMHERFKKDSVKIENLYHFSVQSGNSTLSGVIVAIYQKMCEDGILRDRVLTEVDYIEKLFALIRNRRKECRHVALHALGTVTYHGGMHTCNDAMTRSLFSRLPEHIPTLLRAYEDNTDDIDTAQYVWVIIAHTVVAYLESCKACDSGTVDDNECTLDRHLPRLVCSALSLLRRMDITLHLAEHILDFIVELASVRHKCLLENPSAMNFLLSCLRTNNIHVRSSALTGLSSLFMTQTGLKMRPPSALKPVSNVDLEPLPQHIVDELDEYGVEKTEIRSALRMQSAFMELLHRLLFDGDFLSFSKAFCELILQVEDAIPDLDEWKSLFEHIDEIPGSEPRSFGFACDSWIEVIYTAFTVVAEKDKDSCALNPGTFDHESFRMANILRLKCLLLGEETGTAQVAARSCIMHDSDTAYYYHVLAFASCPEVGLRAAKRGLQCPDLGDGWLRYRLLGQSAWYAGIGALRRFKRSVGSQELVDDGYSFARSCLEDSEAYIKGAPPDAGHMADICSLHIWMSVLLYGHEQGPDLQLFESARKALDFAEDIARHARRPLYQSIERTVARLILEQSPQAAAEWDTFTRRCYGAAAHTSMPDRPSKNAPKRFAVWLALPPVCGGHDVDIRGHILAESDFRRPQLEIVGGTGKAASLYKCSWCGKASAALRKCRGCGKTMYCDSICQKAHWNTSHKSVCKKNIHSNVTP